MVGFETLIQFLLGKINLTSELLHASSWANQLQIYVVQAHCTIRWLIKMWLTSVFAVHKLSVIHKDATEEAWRLEKTWGENIDKELLFLEWSLHNQIIAWKGTRSKYDLTSLLIAHHTIQVCGISDLDRPSLAMDCVTHSSWLGR